VHLHVIPQTFFKCKTFAAIIASERFFAGVRTHVCFKATIFSAYTVTNLALVQRTVFGYVVLLHDFTSLEVNTTNLTSAIFLHPVDIEMAVDMRQHLGFVHAFSFAMVALKDGSTRVNAAPVH